MSDKELGFLVTPGEQQLSVRGVLLPPRALLQTPWQGSQGDPACRSPGRDLGSSLAFGV